jgi:hypothetical protein
LGSEDRNKNQPQVLGLSARPIPHVEKAVHFHHVTSHTPASTRQYLSTGGTQGPIFEDDVPGDYQIVSAGFYARWKRLRVRLQSATGINIQISFFRIGGSLE